MKPIKQVALLHSLCSVGKASITNMMPILSTMGIETCPIPTAILSTHTGGYGIPAKQAVDTAFLRDSVDHFIQNQVTFDAIFIGYLGNPEMALEVSRLIDAYPDALVFVDPIMGDNGRFYSNLTCEYTEAFRKLCKKADYILPNLTEAAALAGVSYDNIRTQEDVKGFIKDFNKMGLQRMIISSVPSVENRISVAVCNNGETEFLTFDKIDTSFHGTGDVFAATLMGHLLSGDKLTDAVVKAHEFTVYCMTESAKQGYPVREGLLLEACLNKLV